MAATLPAPVPAKTRYAVPAVDAMLDLVEHLAELDRPCGVTELSRALGMSTNLAFRVMRRLVDRGYAEVDGGGAYQLGVGLFRLGMRLRNRFELRRRAHPHLERLADRTGETSQLQVLDGRRMLVIEAVSPPADFFLQVMPGSRLHLYCNAFAKAVLAFLPATEVDRLLPARLARLTERTLTSKRALKAELATVRRDGLAYDREEYSDGIFCLGAPVFDVAGQPVGGLGITGLSSRFGAGRQLPAAKLVLAAAAAVSRDLGYAGDRFAKMGVDND